MMKKILFMLIAAFAVVSCQEKDVFDQGAIQNKVIEEYNKAFVRTFGQPAPNQDWGFSTSVLRTRALQPATTFPGDASADKFLTDVPAGVGAYADINYGGGYDSGVSYIDERVSKVNIWGKYDSSIPPYGANAGGTLYVKGNCKFNGSDDFYFAGYSELYIVKGATLTLSAGNAANLQQNTKIYIAEGAKLVASGTLKANKGLEIYNHGDIVTENLETNENSVIYNVGTIKATGKIYAANGESTYVNDGTIECAEMNTAGSSKFQNNAYVNVTGTTTLDSNDNTWVNNGTYKTKYFNYTAGGKDVINNCRLTVTEDFVINLGDTKSNGFMMDGGAGVDAKNFVGRGPFYIHMGSNSVFKVSGTATMDARKADYGIYGDGNEFAVFQANKIVAGAPDQGYLVTYGGNLAVVCDTHFPQGKSGSNPYYGIKGNAVVYDYGTMPEITIPESECNPGFTGKEKDDEVTDDGYTKFIGRVLAEDLSATGGTDFDFNDVVFDVYTNASNKAKVVIMAAGGTLPLTVAGEEIHALFGVDTSVMVNTNAGPTLDPVAIYTDITVTSLADLNKIVVTVTKDESEAPIPLLSNVGEPTAKIAVNKQIYWNNERQEFVKTYEEFKNYVSDPEVKWF